MISLTQSFKVRVAVTDSGRPAAEGRNIIKVSASTNNMMAALSSSNAEKTFANGLEKLIRNARASGTPTAHLPPVDHMLCKNLEVMGFPSKRAICALAACDNNFERALQWLLDNQSVSTAKLEEQVSQHAAVKRQAPGAVSYLPQSTTCTRLTPS